MAILFRNDTYDANTDRIRVAVQSRWAIRRSTIPRRSHRHADRT